jgi:peptidoglycan/xylan/chitin deacetylase (PgdA/CDA1 family)
MVRAAQLSGYTHLFTSVAAETGPFALNNSLFYIFPWVASTYDPVTGLGLPAATTFANIQASITSFGFATVSMTGNEFTNGTVANANQVSELESLITMIQQAGYTASTIQRINFDAAPRIVGPIGNSTCNCVAFRLDNIQDSYLAAAQKAIVALLQSKGVPLTVGVIANAFGNLVANPLDPNNIVPPLQSALQNATNSQCFSLEIGFNGWNYEDFSQLDQPSQESLMTMGITKISGTLNYVPTVFLPPLDLYSALTLAALNATGFTHMSSQTSLDPGPFNYANRVNGIYRFPIAASTSTYLATVYYTPVPAATTYLQVVNQVNIYGWAAVLMHPEEFTNTYGNGSYTTTVNSTQLAVLSSLIDMLRSAGYRLTTIGKIQNYFGNLARDPCLNLYPVAGTTATTAAINTQTGVTFPSLNAAPATYINALLLLFVAMMFFL